MKQSEKEQVFKLTQSLISYDYKNYLAEVYKDEEALSSAVVGNFTVPEAIEITKRLAVQFDAELKSSDSIILPMPWTHSTLGAGSVIGMLENILKKLDEKGTLDGIKGFLEWLIDYQLHFGFWNKSQFKVHDADATALSAEKTELMAFAAMLKTERSELDAMKSALKTAKEEFEKEKQQLNEFAQQKQTELKTISDTLAHVNNQKAEVDQVAKVVANTDAETRAIQKNHAELFDQLKKQKEDQGQDFSTLKSNIEEERRLLKQATDEGDAQVKYFKTLEEFIRVKQKEIIDLGALAAGAALGGTFGLRGDKIGKGMRFWQWAVPGVTLLSMAWIVVVFTCLKATTDNMWINLLLNVAKTIPAFILMGFVFRQYNKERNVMEEYAFKAALANTIKAYADLLKDEDKNENKSRQEMLLAAIKNVQTPPKLKDEQQAKAFSFNTRQLKQTLEQLNDTISNLKK